MAQKIQTIVSYVDDLDDSRDATTSKAFEVGNRKFMIDLCEENSERFDSNFREWTSGLKKRTFAVGKKSYTRWLSEEDAERFDRTMTVWTTAAKRVREDDNEPPSLRPADGRRQSPLETIIPQPMKGHKWWMDPPRPFNRRTGEAFALARRVVREWARRNGWPDLGERGVVPQDAYERWVDEAWLKMDSPSWEQLERPVPSPDGVRGGNPRRQTK